jgi:hypothetical protein
MRTITASPGSSTSTGCPDAGLSSSAGAAAANGRALVAERCVGDRLERLVQRPELTRDAEQLFLRVETTGQRVYLLAEAVEALEERVELAVADFLAFHSSRF